MIDLNDFIMGILLGGCTVGMLFLTYVLDTRSKMSTLIKAEEPPITRVDGSASL